MTETSTETEGRKTDGLVSKMLLSHIGIALGLVGYLLADAFKDIKQFQREASRTLYEVESRSKNNQEQLKTQWQHLGEIRKWETRLERLEDTSKRCEEYLDRRR